MQHPLDSLEQISEVGIDGFRSLFEPCRLRSLLPLALDRDGNTRCIPRQHEHSTEKSIGVLKQEQGRVFGGANSIRFIANESERSVESSFGNRAVVQ